MALSLIMIELDVFVDVDLNNQMVSAKIRIQMFKLFQIHNLTLMLKILLLQICIQKILQLLILFKHKLNNQQ